MGSVVVRNNEIARWRYVVARTNAESNFRPSRVVLKFNKVEWTIWGGTVMCGG